MIRVRDDQRDYKSSRGHEFVYEKLMKFHPVVVGKFC